MKTYQRFAAVLFLFGMSLHAQDSTVFYLRQHIDRLASKEMEGRKAGSIGAEKAAEYIGQQFKSSGLLPLGKADSYLQSFEIISDITQGKANLLSAQIGNTRKNYVLEKDFRPLLFSGNGTAKGSLLFAGFGISAPDLHYDDYGTIDANGKILLVLQLSPDADNPKSEFEKYSPLRYKALKAREKGAIAVIFVKSDDGDSTEKLIKSRFDNTSNQSGIPIITVTKDLANAWLSTRSRNIDSLVHQISLQKKPISFDLSETQVSLTVDLIEKKAMTANVVGLLKVTDTAGTEHIIIGAHYDHLGYGGPDSRSPGINSIHFGADDNASGTAGLLELARLLSKSRNMLKRNIVFIAFTGEEMGILGSTYYTKKPYLPLANASAMFNMDMIGRLKDSILIIQGTGSSSSWESILRASNADSSLKLKFAKDAISGSDQTPFYSQSIPVLFFFTGLHDDYHKPDDTPDKINYAGEARVIGLAKTVVFWIDTMANRPDFIRSAETERPLGAMRGSRAYVGTIPDFSDQGSTGMKISGVREKSPASEAGLQAGDLIVKFGKFDIKNLYDFTYALQESKPGDEVEVRVRRNSSELHLRVKVGRRE